ncbi:hypothetical protein NC651_032966 [Populus alba x Populus x berolinensis]|nr:hypothetical protein NC651_032966 [Populus alba x Populus x berolinensis]
MSTQTQGVKSPPLRGYRRRKTVLDLNAPPTEGRGDEGTSSRNEPQGVQASQQGQSLPTPTIDVDVFDDDVIESSSTAFAEAKNNARRARGRAVVVDVESGDKLFSLPMGKQVDCLTITSTSVEEVHQTKRLSIVIFTSIWKEAAAAAAGLWYLINFAFTVGDYSRRRMCRPCRQRSQPSTVQFACVHWLTRCQQNADTFSVRLALQTQSKDRLNVLLVGKGSLIKNLLECSSQQPVDFDAHIQLLFMFKRKNSETEGYRWSNGYGGF